MTQTLIWGYNPLTVEQIQAIAGHRYGRHPRWVQVMKARHPIRGALGLYDTSMFSGWWPPVVQLRLSSGNIHQIGARSNVAAKILADELNTQLENFLKGLRHPKRLDDDD